MLHADSGQPNPFSDQVTNRPLKPNSCIRPAASNITVPGRNAKCRGRIPKHSSGVRKDLSIVQFCEMLAPLVLRSRTPFAAYLSHCIQLTRQPRTLRKPTPSFCPIPLPFPGVFGRAPSRSKASVRRTLCFQRAIHVMCMALNFWYQGSSFGDMQLLKRESPDLITMRFMRGLRLFWNRKDLS